jgi:hypothetical protein
MLGFVVIVELGEIDSRIIRPTRIKSIGTTSPQSGDAPIVGATSVEVQSVPTSYIIIGLVISKLLAAVVVVVGN